MKALLILVMLHGNPLSAGQITIAYSKPVESLKACMEEKTKVFQYLQQSHQQGLIICQPIQVDVN